MVLSTMMPGFNSFNELKEMGLEPHGQDEAHGAYVLRCFRVKRTMVRGDGVRVPFVAKDFKEGYTQ